MRVWERACREHTSSCSPRGVAKIELPFLAVIPAFGRGRCSPGETAVIPRQRGLPGFMWRSLRVSTEAFGHVLLEHGIEPAPERSRTTSCASFLTAHWGAIAAADVLTVEVLTMGGLVRHQVLVVTGLMTRRSVPGACRGDAAVLLP